MNTTTYQLIETFMRARMIDSAHDMHHVYRVLHQALCIAKGHAEVDLDVLIAACLLHDIGRAAQSQDPSLCHAREGAKMAREFLLDNGCSAAFADHVADAIRTHRFRTDDRPQSIEAKIVFDADKLEATGAIGIARTLIYQGQETIGGIYNVDEAGAVLDGTESDPQYEESFFMEYRRKLEKIYGVFYTEEAREEARKRRGVAETFYQALLGECQAPTRAGIALLREILDA